MKYELIKGNKNIEISKNKNKIKENRARRCKLKD